MNSKWTRTSKEAVAARIESRCRLLENKFTWTKWRRDVEYFSEEELHRLESGPITSVRRWRHAQHRRPHCFPVVDVLIVSGDHRTWRHHFTFTRCESVSVTVTSRFLDLQKQSVSGAPLYRIHHVLHGTNCPPAPSETLSYNPLLEEMKAHVLKLKRLFVLFCISVWRSTSGS